MDLMYRRYADPSSLLDHMISSGRFLDFICSVMEKSLKEEEERFTWEFFLHKVFDKTYQEFLDELEENKNYQKEQKMTEKEFETTFTETMDMLENFVPETEVSESWNYLN